MLRKRRLLRALIAVLFGATALAVAVIGSHLVGAGSTTTDADRSAWRAMAAWSDGPGTLVVGTAADASAIRSVAGDAAPAVTTPPLHRIDHLTAFTVVLTRVPGYLAAIGSAALTGQALPVAFDAGGEPTVWVIRP